MISVMFIFALILQTGCSSGTSLSVTLTPVYLASDTATVTIYKLSDTDDSSNSGNDTSQEAEHETVLIGSGSFAVYSELPRGTEVYSTGNTLNPGTDDSPVILNEIMLDTQNTDSVYYVHNENLTESINQVCTETTKYVRTPVTVYSDKTGAGIAGKANKGAELNITGYSTLYSDGTVEKYSIELTGTELTGWVYAKYLADTQEEANAVYDSIASVQSGRTYPSFDLMGGSTDNLDWYPYYKTVIEGNDFLSETRAVYLNTTAACDPSSYLNLIKEHNINAVVIDIKDGQLAYPADIAAEMSKSSYDTAYTTEEDFRSAVQAFKDAGVYVIGRIVCFNDGYFAADNPDTCISSPESTQAWPSAFSRTAWYYNVQLAVESVEKFGFNEIQFDYVRFPENAYAMSQDAATDFKNTYNEEKAQAIQNFCFYAADTLHEAGAYISVDVFGECADAYVTAYGQYWPAISMIVDAISGMPYTDHYGSSENTWGYPYAIVHTFARRAATRQSEIETPAACRTWITGYNTPNWNPVIDYGYNMMSQQINALYDEGLTGGFIPWNGGSDINKYNEYASIWDTDYPNGDPVLTPDTAVDENGTPYYVDPYAASADQSVSSQNVTSEDAATDDNAAETPAPDTDSLETDDTDISDDNYIQDDIDIPDDNDIQDYNTDSEYP